jgi:Derlin-2/3
MQTPEEWYKGLPLLTRIGLTTFFMTTILTMVGLLNPRDLVLDWPTVINKLQVWRLFTSVIYFGKFGFPFMFQMYFFTSFSQKLERGEVMTALPGNYLFFLLFQILSLDIVSLVLAWPTGLPLLGTSLTFSIIYYYSRLEPDQEMVFYSFKVKGYQLPFALLAFTLLMGGDIWADVLGLASGHIFFFLKEVVKKEYGMVLLTTPSFLNSFMAPYVAGTGGSGGGGGNRFGGFGGGGGQGGGAPPRPPGRPMAFTGGGQRLGGN